MFNLVLLYFFQNHLNYILHNYPRLLFMVLKLKNLNIFPLYRKIANLHILKIV